MSVNINAILLAFASCLCLSACVSTSEGVAGRSPGSFRTRFALVEMNDVPPGRTAAPCLADGSYYSLRNDTDATLDVRISCQLPTRCEPAPGTNYVALPDKKWVKFNPPALKLPPHSEGESLITVSIPDEPRYYGRHFEFWVRADAGAGQVAAALVSRIRVNTLEAGAIDERIPEKPRTAEIRSGDSGESSFWGKLLFWR